MELCDEIQEREGPKWKKRRIEAERERKDKELEEEKSLDRCRRVNMANKKKKDFIKKLEKEGNIQRGRKKESWVQLKQKMWRKLRVKKEEEYLTESEEEIDIEEEAASILEILEELEKNREIIEVEPEKEINFKLIEPKIRIEADLRDREKEKERKKEEEIVNAKASTKIASAIKDVNKKKC